MSFAGKSVLVLGLGRSGRAAAELLARLGARVTGYDRDPTRARDLADTIARDRADTIATESGAAPPSTDAFDVVVASPGFPVPDGTEVVPEVDVAASVLESRIVGVTGTNGKSTVTELIGAMLRESGIDAAVGGNLGTPLCSLVDAAASIVVAELSSFQLEHARVLRPQVAVLLNLAPDHLDRHGDLESYGRAKARMAELQGPEDTLIVNLDDPWARSVPARGTRIGFSVSSALGEDGAWLDGKDLVVRLAGVERVRVAVEALGPGAAPQPANALAAAVAALAAGAEAHSVLRVLETFEGLPHRATLVCVRGGVRFVDDSKATNPSAARASVLAQLGPVVWLLGGRNKGLPFDALRDGAPRTRLAVVYGEAGDAIARAIASAIDFERAAGLDSAFAIARERARAGDTVLLAPACASFDEFASFEARGDHFARLALRVSVRDGEAG